MKKVFILKEWLSENREVVISEFEKLTNEAHYNGITLKGFMLQVFEEMSRQRITSEKSASLKLPFMIGNVVFENSKIEGNDYMIERYKGTQFAQLV